MAAPPGYGPSGCLFRELNLVDEEIPAGGTIQTPFVEVGCFSIYHLMVYNKSTSLTVGMEWSIDSVSSTSHSVVINEVVAPSAGLVDVGNFQVKARYLRLVVTGVATTPVSVQLSFRNAPVSQEDLSNIGGGVAILKEPNEVKTLTSTDASVTISSTATEVNLVVAAASPYQEVSGLITPVNSPVNAQLAGDNTNSFDGTSTTSIILNGLGNTIDTTLNGAIVVGGINCSTTQTQPAWNAGTSVCYGNGNLVDSANTGGIFGGQNNVMKSVTDPCRRCGIFVGFGNTLHDAKDSVIVGSANCTLNTKTGNYTGIYSSTVSDIIGTDTDGSCILSGNGATINNADHSCLIGTNGTITHNGCFLYSDSGGGTALASSATNQFSARCAGGARFYSNTTNTTGVTLATGAGSWASVCDRDKKENLEELNHQDVLLRVASMPVYRYNYIGNPPEQQNLGPVAQDWHGAFPTKEINGAPAKDPLAIENMDAIGVCLSAVKGLYELVAGKAPPIPIDAASASDTRADAEGERSEIRLKSVELSQEMVLERIASLEKRFDEQKLDLTSLETEIKDLRAILRALH